MKTLTIEEVEQVSGAGTCKDAFIVAGSIIGGVVGGAATWGGGVAVGLTAGALGGDIVGAWAC